MAFLCGEIQKQGPNRQTDAFHHLMQAVLEEGYSVLNDMRACVIALKRRAMSAAASATPPRSADFTALADLRQRISRAAHVARLMPIEISTKKM